VTDSADHRINSNFPNMEITYASSGIKLFGLISSLSK
jgi:hypothetical protein